MFIGGVIILALVTGTVLGVSPLTEPTDVVGTGARVGAGGADAVVETGPWLGLR